MTVGCSDNIKEWGILIIRFIAAVKTINSDIVAEQSIYLGTNGHFLEIWSITNRNQMSKRNKVTQFIELVEMNEFSLLKVYTNDTINLFVCFVFFFLGVGCDIS